MYFDNAATTYPKPESVYRAVEKFMREVGGSSGRSAHRRAVETGRVVYAAREELAGLFRIKDPLRIAFTKNATEALNVAIRGLLKRGDHVVTTSMEHNSVMRPLQSAGALDVSYSVVRCSPEGILDPEDVEASLRPETALVVVNHASNLTGTIAPVADVASVARGRGIPIVVDAAQSAGRLEIDVEADGIDVLAFTGHKELFGPQGTGGIYVGEGIKVRPLMCGGTGSRSSSLEQPTEMPDLLESGTLNAPGIAGLAAGVRFVRDEGIGRIREHEVELIERLLGRLEGVDGIEALGPRDPGLRVGIIPLTFRDRSPDEAAGLLDRRYGIAARAGLHCAPLAHRTIGTFETGAVRVSFSHFNSTDEVDYLARCLEEIAG